ncbi:cytochrome c oxidase biogenesis protein Cmc1-like protein [Annulohypoxylon maeteangense]|uniref:cytochrome c oxidase biogenesis protein Cmc1-like protein n=1 Tax=Annulohypoxylon maeteangense TaxID=1927788 RepID=UPI00200749E7|nr:cytochrome c oxidase biogenesis protein Cmc1-like protein [Annulohypoxylon maeteangense]KAI0890415.1 cytochrome c oxidase biogenesis protein Cmc1-like protein [Annulohypoxylon maeteangense]
MHPHLHTKDNTACEDIMNALEECHAKGFLWKSLGMCSDTKDKLTLCLRAERVKRTANNRGIARSKRDEVKRLWDDIDENS